MPTAFLTDGAKSRQSKKAVPVCGPANRHKRKSKQPLWENKKAEELLDKGLFRLLPLGERKSSVGERPSPITRRGIAVVKIRQAAASPFPDGAETGKTGEEKIDAWGGDPSQPPPAGGTKAPRPDGLRAAPSPAPPLCSQSPYPILPPQDLDKKESRHQKVPALCKVKGWNTAAQGYLRLSFSSRAANASVCLPLYRMAGNARESRRAAHWRANSAS